MITMARGAIAMLCIAFTLVSCSLINVQQEYDEAADTTNHNVAENTGIVLNNIYGEGIQINGIFNASDDVDTYILTLGADVTIVNHISVYHNGSEVRQKFNGDGISNYFPIDISSLDENMEIIGFPSTYAASGFFGNTQYVTEDNTKYLHLRIYAETNEPAPGLHSDWPNFTSGSYSIVLSR